MNKATFPHLAPVMALRGEPDRAWTWTDSDKKLWYGPEELFKAQRKHSPYKPHHENTL